MSKLLVCVCVLLFCASSSWARNYMGVNDGLPINASVEDIDTRLSGMEGAGFNMVRAQFSWRMIEPRPGVFDFAATDRYVGIAARYHIQVVPVIFDAPEWASGYVPGSYSGGDPNYKPAYPPRNPRLMRPLMKALIERYGRAGSFWQGDVQAESGVDEYVPIGRTPIRTYQIWNEPNLKAFWGDRPNPRAYVALLRSVYGYSKSIDPAVQIMAAGLPNARGASSFSRYFGAMNRYGVRRYADVFAIHPYAFNASGVQAALKTMRSMMKKHNNKRPIAITEIGWATAGQPSPFTTTEQGQATLLVSSLQSMYQMRETHGIIGWFVYQWQDNRYFPSYIWQANNGLIRLDGSPKPAVRALRKVAPTFTRKVSKRWGRGF